MSEYKLKAKISIPPGYKTYSPPTITSLGLGTNSPSKTSDTDNNTVVGKTKRPANAGNIGG